MFYCIDLRSGRANRECKDIAVTVVIKFVQWDGCLVRVCSPFPSVWRALIEGLILCPINVGGVSSVRKGVALTGCRGMLWFFITERLEHYHR